MGFCGCDGVAENAQWRAAIYFFESLQDRAAKIFVPSMLAHVVNTKGDNSINPVFPHPLGGGKSREAEPYMEWVCLIQIGEAVACRLGCGMAKHGG